MNRPSSIIHIPHSAFHISHFNSHSPFPIPHSPFKRGFTFIELIFVTLALGLLVLTATPRIRQAWVRLQIERTAFFLAQMLRTARTLAITNSQPIAWVWDPAGRRVWLGTQHDDDLPDPLSGRFGRPHPIPEQVRLSVMRDEEAVAQVNFFPNGTSQPTTVLISDPLVPRYQIAVDETTGQVVVKQTSLPAR
jgi:prepilin-type N-terminal cleavage/methylation domain-containing protein